MDDQQRLAKLLVAEGLLKQTTRGYTPTGVYWKRAMQLLDEVEEDLRDPPPPPVPSLGPIWAGGKSVLLQDLTHMTSGMTGANKDKYPAFDDAFGKTGASVLAPEGLAVTRQSGAQGADAFYATGLSGIKYWVGHVVAAPPTGTKFVKGTVMAKVANLSAKDGGPHVHLGIDARAITGGKVLLHHVDYTHGAPLVGVQLRAALSV